ncbi:MAG TPA: hypothetical protein VFL28_13525 [bacterium]|nr:hypothetical protein [bacterium]
MIHRGHTAVVERNVRWAGAFSTEPYEAAWASEAIFFVRTLEPGTLRTEAAARVQISPDGMRWADEGTAVPLRAGLGVTFGRVSHFGGWLRLAGELGPGEALTVIVYLVLKE